MIVGTQELWVPRDVPKIPDLFVDRATGTPLRWKLQVEVLDDLPTTRVFVWESGHPRLVFGMPHVGNTTMIRPVEDNFRGINQVTGLPNAFELRDLVIQHAVR